MIAGKDGYRIATSDFVYIRQSRTCFPQWPRLLWKSPRSEAFPLSALVGAVADAQSWVQLLLLGTQVTGLAPVAEQWGSSVNDLSRPLYKCQLRPRERGWAPLRIAERRAGAAREEVTGHPGHGRVTAPLRRRGRGARRAAPGSAGPLCRSAGQPGPPPPLSRPDPCEARPGDTAAQGPGPHTCQGPPRPAAEERRSSPPRRGGGSRQGAARPPPAQRCLPVAARSRRPPAPARARVPGKTLGAARRPGGASPSSSAAERRAASARHRRGRSPTCFPRGRPRSQDVAAADGCPAARCAARCGAGGGAREWRPPRRGALPLPASPAPCGGPAALAPRQVRPEPRKALAALLAPSRGRLLPSRGGRASCGRERGAGGCGSGGWGGDGAAGGGGPVRDWPAPLWNSKSYFPAMQTLRSAVDASPPYSLLVCLFVFFF